MPDARYLRIAVPSPLYQDFDYLPPEGMDPAALVPGMRLKLPFGRRELVGVLLEIATDTHVAESKLKVAHKLLDTVPAIPSDILALARWAADYYRHPIGEVMQTLLPVLLRQGRPAISVESPVWQLSPSGHAADQAALIRAPRQLTLYCLLRQHPEGMSSHELTQLDPGNGPAIKALVRRGWVEKAERAVHRAPSRSISTPALNPAQEKASAEIIASLGSYHCYLLDGVTGSGKTEVYMAAIAAVLKRGLQALVLLPEINLTPQTLGRFRARFGQVAAFHSGLNDTERLGAWLAARDGQASVIVGTRSAAWVPLQRPGLIVVDEEHDASFKQQDGFRYSARDLAVVRAQRACIPVVLGSATPSLESLQNATQGRYHHLILPERAGSARQPEVRLLDIRTRPLNEGLSDLMVDAISHHLGRDGQVLLFLNRRGYAPTFLCHDCGHTEKCHRCDARMTLHGRYRLVCHHCGAERSAPLCCTQCGGSAFGIAGHGTERIEQALASLFPNVGVARVDRDSTRRKGSLERILEEVREHRQRLLVGTQMLAKGHDFPNVTLVGVLDADQGLFSADFRASERMAQLITQVAGRAGRAERPGEVLIQTHQPDHPLLRQLVREGYGSFARAALEERKLADLPPYAALALLRAEAPSVHAPTNFLDAARECLEKHLGGGREVNLLGPAPAPMERRAGRYRAHLLLQAPQRAPIQRLLSAALLELGALKLARRVRWSVDVDPISLD